MERVLKGQILKIQVKQSDYTIEKREIPIYIIAILGKKIERLLSKKAWEGRRYWKKGKNR